MTNQEIILPVYGIIISLVTDENGTGGSINSDLKTGKPEDATYDTSMDVLEAMVLGHACAGVDVKSPAYLEGIETAVEAAANLIDDDEVEDKEGFKLSVQSSYVSEDVEKEYDEHLIVTIASEEHGTEDIASFHEMSLRTEIDTMLERINDFTKDLVLSK